MAEDNIITLKEAAKRARTSVADVALGWAQRHGVELIFDDATGKIAGLDRAAFERGVNPVDPEVRAWLDGSARQLRERERSRLGQRGHSVETAAAVRRHLEGDKPAGRPNTGKAAPPAISSPGNRRWQSLEEVDEPSTEENVRWLKDRLYGGRRGRRAGGGGR